MSDFKNRAIASLSAGSLLCLTVFLFTPLLIFLTNAREFPYPYSDILGPLIGAALIGVAVISGLLLILPNSWSRFLTPLVFALGFLVYLQGNWILWNYGSLDGREIDWAGLSFRGFVDGGVWVGLLALLVWRGVRWRKTLSWIAILIVIVQGVNIGSPFDGHPELKDIFDGFTFYRNGLSGYPTTKGNPTLMLTGKYFRNEMPAFKFIQKVSREKGNLPRFLKEHGFRSHLLGTHGLFIGVESNSDINIVRLRDIKGVSFRNELLYLADLTAFRVLPHFAKEHIYNDQKWVFKNYFGDHELEGMPPVENLDDLVFLKRFSEQARADDGKPVFKYIHLWGVHPPIRLDEKLNYVELPATRDNFIIYTRAGVEMLRQLIDKLKELGVYDETLIVMTGDHGGGFHHYAIDPRAGGVADELIEDTTVPSLIKSSAVPAILIKEIGSRGSLKITDVPVTIGDYPASIAGSLGFKHSFPGVDFLTGRVDPERERLFYFYVGYNTNETDYFDGFTEYRIRGHSWLDASWMRADSIFPAGERKGRIYHLGERISFTRDGNHREFAPYGFSIPGEKFTWTDRNQAGINVQLSQPTGDLICRMGIGMVWGLNQEIGVWLDGRVQLEKWMYERGASEEETREFIIPESAIRNGGFTLEFRMPNANISPKEAGLSSDPRRLGLGLAWLEFEER